MSRSGGAHRRSPAARHSAKHEIKHETKRWAKHQTENRRKHEATHEDKHRARYRAKSRRQTLPIPVVGGGIALAVVSLGTSVAISQSIGPKSSDPVTTEVAAWTRVDTAHDKLDRDEALGMMSAVAEKKRQEQAAAEAAAAQAAAEAAAKAEAEARAKAEAEARAKAEAEARAKAEAEAAAKAEAARQARAEAASRALARTRTPSGAKELARALIGEYGWGDSQFSCLEKLWTRESEWNYKARNPSSGAYGIPQSLPGSKMASAGSDWRDNPETQIKWGLGYIDDRYGTPCAAWNHSEARGWY